MRKISLVLLSAVFICEALVVARSPIIPGREYPLRRLVETKVAEKALGKDMIYCGDFVAVPGGLAEIHAGNPRIYFESGEDPHSPNYYYGYMYRDKIETVIDPDRKIPVAVHIPKDFVDSRTLWIIRLSGEDFEKANKNGQCLPEPRAKEFRIRI